MKKIVFKNKKGEIHLGFNAGEDFTIVERKDLDETLFNLGKNKLLWRCTVCNDLHIGPEPPKECPTCFQKDAYIEMNLGEFKKITEVL